MSKHPDLRHPDLTHPGLGRSLPFLKNHAKRVVLKQAVSGGETKTFRLFKDRIVIGSVASADVRLVGDGVSPIHAVMEVSKPDEMGKVTVTIFDLASDTGLFINGEKAVTRVLATADELKVGPYQLKFSLEDYKRPGARDVAGLSAQSPLNDEDQAIDRDFKPLLLEDEHGVEEIFDYRPSMSKQAVETVMSWNGLILDVKHFVQKKQVVIGDSRKADFAIPHLLSDRNFRLVSREGENYTLHLDPKMKGVMQRGSELFTLDELRARMPMGGQGPETLTFKRDDFAKISLNDIDFYLSFTAAPPKLKRGRLLERDPLLYRVVGSSLILSAALIAAMMNAEVTQTVDAEQLPDRLATILYQPEKYTSRAQPVAPAPVPEAPKAPTPEEKTPPAPPKPVAKQEMPKPNPPKDAKASNRNVPKGGPRTLVQGEAKEGEGARAKGPEGSRGSKTSNNRGTPQNVAMRPSPEGGKGRGGGNSQVEGQGNVDLLRGASDKIQNLLGASANRLGTGGEKLQGFGAFNTIGNGGLGLSGRGAGGGGNAETTLGGLGNKGTGGGRVGTGKGAAGDGSGIIGGKARVVIRGGGQEEVVVMGSIDQAAIDAAIRARRDDFNFCAENEVKTGNTGVSGRVGTTFVIGSSGRVTEAGVVTTTLNAGHNRIETCVLRVLRDIQFPSPKGGTVVTVKYPFKYDVKSR